MQERLSIPSHLLLLWILAGASSASALESATTRLRLDPANGSIVSIVDKLSGRDCATKPAPLYELNFAGPTLRLTSLDAVGVTVKEDDRGLVVEAPRHGNTGVHVTCTFRPLDGTPFILGRIEIRLDEPRKLASVWFPTVNLSLPLGDAGNDDAVLLPYCDGCVVTNPLANGVNRKLTYPGSASMQLLAAFDKTAGVYLACHDSQGHLKRFSVRKQESALHLSVDHVPEHVPVREWSLSYDVAISTFRGVSGADSTTWEDAANLYRSWAVEQPWCRRTLAQRVSAGDVPKWLTQPSLFYAYSLRGDSKEGKRINRLPLVVEQADAWREVTGGPTTFMLMAWEKHGAWVTPDYFPPVGGAKAFRAATSELHARGHRTLVFLSGLKWTLQKNTKGGTVDDRQEFDRRGRAHAISDPTGKAAIYGEPEHGVGQHAQICAATPLAREILLDSTLQCQQLGIDCVQVDQIVGGGLPPCYHPDHGHPPGGGNWCAKRLLRLEEEDEDGARGPQRPAQRVAVPRRPNRLRLCLRRPPGSVVRGPWPLAEPATGRGRVQELGMIRTCGERWRRNMRLKRANKSMTRRTFIGTMAAGAMAVFLAPLVAAQDAGTKPLNVVFIVIEDMSPHLGCYGNPFIKTPNIVTLPHHFKNNRYG